jgi:hypothetical protein
MIYLNLEKFLSCDLIRLVQQNPHLSNMSYVMQKWARTFSFFSPQIANPHVQGHESQIRQLFTKEQRG